MSLTLIAALDLENGIGKNNQLLWHLPDDFARFKQLTMGHCVIMGRKTWESLPKLLPKRTHIIISREELPLREHCVVTSSIEEAIVEAKKERCFTFCHRGRGDLPANDFLGYHLRAYSCTGTYRSRYFFPRDRSYPMGLIERVFHPKDERHAYDFYFETYNKHL